MRALLLWALLPFTQQEADRFEQWLCQVLRAQTPETILDEFPDEGASEASPTRRRVGMEIEEWELVSAHYRLRLRYRQTGGSALRTGFEISVRSNDAGVPFWFPSLEAAERWLRRLGAPESRSEGLVQYSETREGSREPHFRVSIDVVGRSVELAWEEKWLVDHPSPLYRRFGPDYRERICEEER